MLDLCCCFERKGDPKKCIPFYVVGGVLIVAGLPLMLVGIIATFTVSDFVAYAGGICVLFGIMFVLTWHMFTIKNLQKHEKSDRKVRKFNNHYQPRRLSNDSFDTSFDMNNGEQDNPAYETTDRELPGLQSPGAESYEMYERAKAPSEENNTYEGGYDNPAMDHSPNGDVTHSVVVIDDQIQLENDLNSSNNNK